MIFQPANTTALTTPSSFRVVFPLPLGSHFPPPLTTESTSCSIVPSPTSKHNEIHVWAFTIASTHHFASAMHLPTTPSSNQQTQPQRALTTASTADTTTDHALFTQQAHPCMFKFNFPFYNCNFTGPRAVRLPNTPPHRSTIPCRLDFRKIHYKAYPSTSSSIDFQ